MKGGGKEENLELLCPRGPKYQVDAECDQSDLGNSKEVLSKINRKLEKNSQKYFAL